MVARNKVGFLGSIPGNPTGIGDYVRTLDEYGIPAVTFANDATVGISDVLNLQTLVPHVMLFRVVKDGSEYWSVPDYNKDPYSAALEHWNKIRPHFPPEIVENRHKVWIKPINEVDHERSNWLGYFGVELAKIANSAGFRVSLFGFSSGEPEKEDWFEPGMVAYLNYCANHKEVASVCLHEYSFNINNILDGYPYKVGRFKFLYEVCDELNIPRPYVLIGEWGWTYSEVPDPTTAIQHIDTVAAIYAKYKDLLGAGIWYLGKYQNTNIHNLTQKLIAPVTELTITKEYSGEDPPPPTPNDCAEPRLDYTRTYVFIHNSVSLEEATQIASDAFKAKNTVGFSADDAGLGVNCLTHRFIKAWGVPTAERQGYLNWWNLHYPGVVVTFHDINPPVTETLLGLHASADPILAVNEVEIFKTAKIEMVKVLSNLRQTDVIDLKNALPKAEFVVRAFLDFGGRDIKPSQFVNDTYTDVRRTLDVLENRKVYIELHNEPNLVQEGLNSSWYNGTEFNEWFMFVLQMYRDLMPGVSFLYPGLSPGGTIAGIRQDHVLFVEQSRSAVLSADLLGVHAYWAYNYPMQQAINVVKDYHNRFPLKQIIVTEASNNKELDFDLKGYEYITFCNELSKLKNIKGVTYFVASATHPDFQEEVWVRNGNSTGIAEVVGSR